MSGRASGVTKEALGFMVLLLGVVFAALSASQLTALGRSIPLVYDEAYNLQVPYELVHRGEYRALECGDSREKMGCEPRLFSPRVTTGPALLLPATLNYLLRGDPLNLRGREVALLFAVSVPLVFGVMLGIRSSSSAAVGLGVAYAGNLFSSPWIGQAVAFRVMGEGPGLFLLLAGMACFAVTGARRWRLLGGAFFAAAVLSKLLFLVAAVGFLLCFKFCSRRSDPERSVWPSILSFLIVLMSWQCVQLFVLGPSHFLKITTDGFTLLGSINGGAVGSPFGQAGRVLMLQKIRMWGEHLVSRWELVLPVALASLFILTSSGGSKETFWRAMVGAGALHLGWFIFLAPTLNPRHGCFGIMVLYLGLVGWGLTRASTRFGWSGGSLSWSLWVSIIVGYMTLWGMQVGRGAEGDLYAQGNLAKALVQATKGGDPNVLLWEGSEHPELYGYLVGLSRFPMSVDALTIGPYLDQQDPGAEYLVVSPSQAYNKFFRCRIQGHQYSHESSLWWCLGRRITEGS